MISTLDLSRCYKTRLEWHLRGKTKRTLYLTRETKLRSGALNLLRGCRTGKCLGRIGCEGSVDNEMKSNSPPPTFQSLTDGNEINTDVGISFCKKCTSARTQATCTQHTPRAQSNYKLNRHTMRLHKDEVNGSVLVRYRNKRKQECLVNKGLKRSMFGLTETS